MTVRHGTASRYAQGCRCLECRIAKNREQRRYLAWVQSQPVPADKHGTVSGYMTYACRCAECKSAMQAYRRRRRDALLTAQSLEEFKAAA